MPHNRGPSNDSTPGDLPPVHLATHLQGRPSQEDVQSQWVDRDHHDEHPGLAVDSGAHGLEVQCRDCSAPNTNASLSPRSRSGASTETSPDLCISPAARTATTGTGTATSLLPAPKAVEKAKSSLLAVTLEGTLVEVAGPGSHDDALRAHLFHIRRQETAEGIRQNVEPSTPFAPRNIARRGHQPQRRLIQLLKLTRDIHV